MATLFSLEIGYRKYLMSAQDAAKVLDLLGSATCVARDWVGGAPIVHYASPEEISLKPLDFKVEHIVSKEDYEAARDEETAAYQRRREAEKTAREQEDAA